MIRYAIGDVTDEPLEKPQQGFSILKSIAGRHNDTLLSRSGQCFHTTYMTSLLEEFLLVRLYHVHQRSDGSVVMKIESVGPSGHEVARLERRLSELLEGYPITVDLVDRIPHTPSGKHRFVVSDLAQSVVSGHRPYLAQATGRLNE